MPKLSELITGPQNAAPSRMRLSQVVASAPGDPRAGMTLEERYAAQGINPNQYNGTQGGSELNIAGFNTGIDTPQWLDRTLSGAGKSVADTAQGIGQLTGNVDQAEVDERKRIDAPLMDTGAGMAGNIGGQVAQMAVPVGGGARLASYAGRAAPFISAAARGAAFAGLQPMATGQDRLTETAVGGALGAVGQGIASGVGRLAQIAKARLPDAVEESINLARRAGIPLHMSQVTMSKPLKTIQSALSYLPFSGAGKAAQKQQEAFNAAVGRSFGVQDARALTDKVMVDARKALSDQYNQVFGRNSIAIDPNDARAIANIEKGAFSDLIDDNAQLVKRKVDQILEEFGNGPVAGSRYQNLRDALKADDPAINRWVKRLREVVDNAAFRSVGSADAALLKRLNSQWANMRTATDALKQSSGAAGQLGGSAGNVRPSSLWGLQRGGSTKEMRALAQMGQNVLKELIPDSGTAGRMALMSGLGIGGGAASMSDNQTISNLGKLLLAGSTLGRISNSPLAARLLQQGAPMSALSRLVQPAPRLLPTATSAVAAPLEIDVSGGMPGKPISKEELEKLRAGID